MIYILAIVMLLMLAWIASLEKEIKKLWRYGVHMELLLKKHNLWEYKESETDNNKL